MTVKHPYKRVRMSQKNIEIFVDLNRAGQDKSVPKTSHSSTNIYEVMT